MTDRPKRAGNGKGKGSGADPSEGGANKGGANKGEGDLAGTPPPADYGVGYGRPPLHTRFQKGQPRPPRKPKPETEPGVDDWFEEELRQPMRFVDENGKEQVFPKGKVLVKTSVNKAIKNGDLRSVKEFMPRRPAKQGEDISQTDLEMVARFLAKWLPAGLTADAIKGLTGDPGGTDEGAGQ